MPAGKKMDEHTIDRIRQLLRQGLSTTVICDRLRISEPVVRKIRNSMVADSAKLTEPASEA